MSPFIVEVEVFTLCLALRAHHFSDGRPVAPVFHQACQNREGKLKLLMETSLGQITYAGLAKTTYFKLVQNFTNVRTIKIN